MHGWRIDNRGERAARVAGFTQGAHHGILASLGQMLGGVGGGESFAQACPGGAAPAGASAALADRCHVSLVEATRSGVIISLCFYLWAGFHYFLGSIGLVKALAEARKGRGED